MSSQIASSGGLRVIEEVSGAARIPRRKVAQILLSAAASGFVLPACSAESSVWQHIAHFAVPDSADAELAAPNWKPLFLSPAQEETLRASAEVMVPGSTKALVSRFIDLLLSVKTEVAQKKFVGAIEAVDQQASSKYAKTFAKLSAQEQSAILTAISSEPREGENASWMRGHFEDLKEWIVPAYYSSEMGMKELGWTPDRVFATFPSCEHPERHS